MTISSNSIITVKPIIRTQISVHSSCNLLLQIRSRVADKIWNGVSYHVLRQIRVNV
jgi:hypothetical protein